MGNSLWWDSSSWRHVGFGSYDVSLWEKVVLKSLDAVMFERDLMRHTALRIWSSGYQYRMVSSRRGTLLQPFLRRRRVAIHGHFTFSSYLVFNCGALDRPTELPFKCHKTICQYCLSTDNPLQIQLSMLHQIPEECHSYERNTYGSANQFNQVLTIVSPMCRTQQHHLNRVEIRLQVRS